MHEMDRHELDGSEPAVDPAHELVHRRAQVLVFFYVLAGRDGELCEDDLDVRARRRHSATVSFSIFVSSGCSWCEKGIELEWRGGRTFPIHSGC